MLDKKNHQSVLLEDNHVRGRCPVHLFFGFHVLTNCAACCAYMRLTLTHTRYFVSFVPFWVPSVQVRQVLVRVQQGGHDLDRGHGQAGARAELDRRVGAHEA